MRLLSLLVTMLKQSSLWMNVQLSYLPKFLLADSLILLREIQLLSMCLESRTACDSWIAVQYSRAGLPMYHHPKEPLVMSIQYTTCLIWYYYVTHMSSVMSLEDLPFFMHIWIRSFTRVRYPPKILFGIISYLNIVLTWLLACFLL